MYKIKWSGAWQKGKKCSWCGKTLGNRIGDTDKYHESCLKQKEKANGKKVLREL